MATYYTLLTKIGQARIANAVALNQKVNLTYMAVGDGNGNPTTPNENQTALVREKYRATINQLTVDPDNPNYLVAELIVPTTVGGWSIYEVGVFDDQNQLIAVANFPATYKPELAEGSGRDLIVRIIIQVSNTSVVTLKIDPAITLASQAWVAANYVKKITVAGGTTGQVLVKKSNANEDFQWVDPTAAVDVNVFSREETQTVATGQTIINLAQLTTDGAAIYIEGIRLRDDQFTVNSPTRLTLATSYPAGTKVTIVQNEETSRNAFTLKANNLSDLTDKPQALKNLGLADSSGYIGKLLGVRRITASGTYSPTPGTKKIRVRAVGGGGGGGGVPATAAGTQATAKGGESGAYVEAIITLETTADIIATIGTGGAGGAAGSNTGVDGGATTLGSLLTCPGGKGGEGGSTSTINFVTSDASSQMAPTTTGTIVYAISTCRPSLGRVGLANAASVGGAGGSSMLGFGGGGGTVNVGNRTESVSGAGFGAGGGGGSSCVGSAAMAGAAGTSGVILIEEFA